MLDIGSNSAQLQIVDVRPGAPPLPAHAVKEPTLLGEEILPDESISDDGVERDVRAVADAVTAAARHGVDQLYPFATSAVRDAVNREAVVDRVDRVERGVGIRPQFLDGGQEARLTCLAAHRWYGWSAGGCCCSTSAAGRWRSHSAATQARTWRCRCRWAPGG
ncbi:hypothetical protein GCM10022267_08040 [Lentzea roselyniae]|uniref:Ppx/GppA phosphatase N-terminal domain-containing protein n=1 Tax=Lentzea roselyniae TaxID=531940 RepID=A0ABP7A3R9_9PSEU